VRGIRLPIILAGTFLIASLAYADRAKLNEDEDKVKKELEDVCTKAVDILLSAEEPDPKDTCLLTDQWCCREAKAPETIDVTRSDNQQENRGKFFKYLETEDFLCLNKQVPILREYLKEKLAHKFTGLKVDKPELLDFHSYLLSGANHCPAYFEFDVRLKTKNKKVSIGCEAVLSKWGNIRAGEVTEREIVVRSLTVDGHTVLSAYAALLGLEKSIFRDDSYATELIKNFNQALFSDRFISGGEFAGIAYTTGDLELFGSSFEENCICFYCASRGEKDCQSKKCVELIRDMYSPPATLKSPPGESCAIHLLRGYVEDVLKLPVKEGKTTNIMKKYVYLETSPVGEAAIWQALVEFPNRRKIRLLFETPTSSQSSGIYDLRIEGLTPWEIGEKYSQIIMKDWPQFKE